MDYINKNTKEEKSYRPLDNYLFTQSLPADGTDVIGTDWLLINSVAKPEINQDTHYLEALPTVEVEGLFYEAWEVLPMSPAAIMSKQVRQATQLVEEYIQEPIDAYNKEHGLQFGSVHNCANYINNPEYTHYQFCKDVWDWQVLVWETVRAANVTTLEELTTILPEYTGTI